MQRLPRLVIAAPSSGAGKTTVTLALARALSARGLRVAVFKCGPDYLDPTYHQRATGSVCHTLDPWMMGEEGSLRCLLRDARDVDLALIEGVMGLFDSAQANDDEGSTAQLARWLKAPVVLVVDVSGMARTLAALVAGLSSFDPRVCVAGVIGNRAGSPSHARLLHDCLRFHVPHVPWLGALERQAAHSFDSRHLGLTTATTHVLTDAQLDHWAQQAEGALQLDALMRLARQAPPLPASPREKRRTAQTTTVRIGLARDEAFHFYYDDNLRRLCEAGATLVPFSPVRDGALPDLDGLYIGGGYPELFARELSANVAMRESVSALCKRQAPVYAECGGLMYLTQAIVTDDGTRHPMVGLFDAEATMHGRLRALGYVEVETTRDSILGPVGTRFRGHEFRYSDLRFETPRFAEPTLSFRVTKRRNGELRMEGHTQHQTLASYVHAHWASNPKIPWHFVRACARYRARTLRALDRNAATTRG